MKENNKILNFQNNKIKMIRFWFEIRFDFKIKLEIDQSQGFLSEEDCRCNACRLFGFLPIYNKWRIIMSNRKAFASWHFMCRTYRRSILHMDIFCTRFQTTDIATKCQSPMQSCKWQRCINISRYPRVCHILNLVLHIEAFTTQCRLKKYSER